MRLYRVRMPKRSRLRLFASDESRLAWLERRGLDPEAAEPVRRRDVLFAIVFSLNPVLLIPIVILAACTYFGTKQYLEFSRAFDRLDVVGRTGTAIVTRESGSRGGGHGRVMEYAFQPREGEVMTGLIQSVGSTNFSRRTFGMSEGQLPAECKVGWTFPVRFDPTDPGVHLPSFVSRAVLAEEREKLKVGLLMMGGFAGFLLLIMATNALGILAGLPDERLRPKRRSRVGRFWDAILGRKQPRTGE